MGNSIIDDKRESAFSPESERTKTPLSTFHLHGGVKGLALVAEDDHVSNAELLLLTLTSICNHQTRPR